MRLAITALASASFLAAAGVDSDSAQTLYNHTRYSEVIAALSGEQQDAASLQLLGQSYFMQADFKHAVEALEKAALQDHRSSTIQTWLGRAYGRRAETSSPLSAMGWAKKSGAAFQKAVQLDAHNADAAGDLFDFYIQAPGIVGGGVEKARNLIPAIAAIDPSQAQFAQARIAEEDRHLSDAEAKFRRAIELAPRELGRLLDLAQFLTRVHRYDEAELTFARAEKLQPHSPQILFAKAESYVASKRNPDEARNLLHQYLSSNLTPNDPPRSEALKLLRKVEGA